MSSFRQKIENANSLGDLLKSLPRKGILAAAAATTLLGGALASTHTLGTTEVGVRVRKIGIPFLTKKGIVNETYQPGQTYFFLPFVNDWYTLETSPQTLRFEGEDKLKFKTADGNDIELNLTVFYKIRPEDAPRIVREVGQTNEEVREKVAIVAARSRIRDGFGLLSTEGFYSATSRNEAAEVTGKALLQEILGPYHLDVVSINTGNFEFANPNFRKAIQDMKNADQDASRIAAQVLAQKEANQRMISQADASLNTKIVTANGAYERDSITADAKFQQDSILAEATLAEGRNRAASIAAERRAMMTSGGRTRVYMAITEALKDKPIYMIPSMSGGAIQTFDINQFMTKLGLDKVTGRQP
jgi:regulator of protease activity HflC (stomatin/prohibitin superfamily)